MDKKQKKTPKRILLRIVVFLIITVLIAYLGYNTFMLLTSSTDTFVVDEGTLDLSELVDAYIIRDETILQGNNYKNGMEKIVSEGKRVAKGDSVFRYYVNGEDTIKNEITDLDKKISEAQKNETAIYTTDIEILKSKIKELEEKIYVSNNIEEIENYKKEIADYNYKVSTIVGELSPSGSYLKELINEKTKYLNQLTNGAEEITTANSGTVSYRIDNMEDVFTVSDNFAYLTSEFLENLNLKTGELVESSTEKGKVITDFSCYLAIEMDSETAMAAEVGDKVKIRYDVDEVIDSKIVTIKEENDKRILIFKIEDLPEKMISYRKIAVEVIWWEYSGLKIPNTALIKEDDKNYIIRERAGYNVKVLVKVLKQNSSYSIVDNYTTQELQEMGYSYDEINDMYSVKQYDKIVVNNN